MVSHSHELLRQIPVMIYFKYWLAAPARLSARNATTTTAVTSAGRTLHVSLKLVDPPAGAPSLVRPLPRPDEKERGFNGKLQPQPSHALLLQPRPRHRLLRLPRLAPCSLALPVVPPIPASAVRLSNQTAVHSPHVALSTMCRMLFVFLQVHQ